MSGLLANPSDVSVLWLKDGRPHAVKVGTLKVDHGVATWIRADGVIVFKCLESEICMVATKRCRASRVVER